MLNAYRAASRAAGKQTRATLVVATAVGMSVIVPPVASAQVMDPLRGYSLDGSPLGPQRAAPRERQYEAPGREEREEEASSERIKRQRPVLVSASHIRRLAEQQGYRLISTPHRHGRSYFAYGENGDGHRFELMFSAANGYIVGQRDLGPTVAAKAAQPAPVSAAAAAPQPAPSPVPVAAPASNSVDIAAARAEAERAAAAEAEAKREMDARASASRKAQAKLAEAEAEARRADQAKQLEARRQEALAAAQRRMEAQAAETKRRTLAAAEAKLAQAKAMQARAEAEMKRAESDAASARAALAPAEMNKAAQAPVEVLPVANSSSAKTDPKQVATVPPATDAAAMSGKPDMPATMPKAGGSDEAATPVDAPKGLPGDGAGLGAPLTPDAVGQSSAMEPAEPARAAPVAVTEMPAKRSDTAIDPVPTGSTRQSPPEPYAAPTPTDTENP